MVILTISYYVGLGMIHHSTNSTTYYYQQWHHNNNINILTDIITIAIIRVKNMDDDANAINKESMVIPIIADDDKLFPSSFISIAT